MKVLIVGAGIAGLSAGIGLRRAGHDVQILEKSSLLHEIGAAINLQPNATRVLAKWGYSPSRSRSIVSRTWTYADAASLRVIDHQVTEGTFEKYGGEMYFIHRVDLHNELKHLATREEGAGKPIEIMLKKIAIEYDVENGQVTCADGTSFTGDLVIGADGIHSTAIKYVIGHDNPPISTGRSCFRLLIPTDQMIVDNETEMIKGGDGRLYAFIGPEKRLLITYPCRNHEIQNIAFVYPDKDQALEEDWHADISLEALLREASEYHPSLQTILKQARPGDIKLWPLLSRKPLPTWRQKRLLLVGDAAHPMLPYQGQAAAQAIEDAAALEALFTDFTSTDVESVIKRLQSFENIRLKYAAAVQTLSDHTHDAPDKLVEWMKPYMKAEEVPLYPQEQAHWRMIHDVDKEIQTELAKISGEAIRAS